MPVSLDNISASSTTAVQRPVMRQSWLDLTFIHWRYDPNTVRALLPAELELDLSDGECWVGLVPFRIAELSLPNSLSVPWLSTFAETNVRTYVVDRSGRRGVWFFSLDAARLLAVASARAMYGLPYFWASMAATSTDHVANYRSQRILRPKEGAKIQVHIGAPLEKPGRLELFLTARFRLYARRWGRLVTAPINHNPWPLQHASIEQIDQTLIQASGLPAPLGLPLVHFARRVDVLIGWPEMLLDADRSTES